VPRTRHACGRVASRAARTSARDRHAISPRVGGLLPPTRAFPRNRFLRSRRGIPRGFSPIGNRAGVLARGASRRAR
jgi:hypothetical protein